MSLVPTIKIYFIILLPFIINGINAYHIVSVIICFTFSLLIFLTWERVSSSTILFHSYFKLIKFVRVVVIISVRDRITVAYKRETFGYLIIIIIMAQ